MSETLKDVVGIDVRFSTPLDLSEDDCDLIKEFFSKFCLARKSAWKAVLYRTRLPVGEAMQ